MIISCCIDFQWYFPFSVTDEMLNKYAGEEKSVEEKVTNNLQLINFWKGGDFSLKINAGDVVYPILNYVLYTKTALE